MNNLKHTVFRFGLPLFFLFLPATTWALVGPPQKCDVSSFEGSFKCALGRVREEAGIKEVEPLQVILSILKVGLTLVAIAGVIGLIIAGGMYMFSAGDETKAAKAKKAILYVIIGLLIIGASILIVNLIINAFQGAPAVQPQPKPS